MSLEKQIQKELEYLDLDLFLDKDLHPLYGFLCYSVKRRMKDGVEPLMVVPWWVGTVALPLSLQIVDVVRSQEGDIRDAIAQATANNAAKKELQRQKMHEAWDDASQDWQKSGKKTWL